MLEAADALLSLPAPVIALLVAAIWGLIAFAIHRFAVPFLCGKDGRKLGKFEAEVTSQIALAFGLLISFNAVWIWDRSERVHAAVVDEAIALNSIVSDAELLEDAALRDALCAGVGAYAKHLIEVEWPTLSDSSAQRSRPAEFRALTVLVRKTNDDHMRDALNTAEEARDLRIRDGLAHMSPPRWGVVVMLGLLLLVSIGALHGESRRGRILALTLVTLAISFCFAVLLVHARPFVGAEAIRPDDLRDVLFRASTRY